jgi:subtilisin family serine protease
MTPPAATGTHVAGTIAAVGNNGLNVPGVAWRFSSWP